MGADWSARHSLAHQQNISNEGVQEVSALKQLVHDLASVIKQISPEHSSVVDMHISTYNTRISKIVRHRIYDGG